jgi:photoactive yellow protein
MADAAESLDNLSPSEIDALDFGVSQLDGQGQVLVWNPAQAELTGATAVEARGRNFFKDIAPATHRPSFYGRFLEGVRRPPLDEVFGFTFSTGARPVQTAVRMTEARAPGKYWIVVQPLALLDPARRNDAAYAVSRQTLAAGDLDADVCAREPIHIPGAIQPHAALLALTQGRAAPWCAAPTPSTCLALGRAGFLGSRSSRC